MRYFQIYSDRSWSHSKIEHLIKKKKKVKIWTFLINLVNHYDEIWGIPTLWKSIYFEQLKFLIA